MRVEKPVHLYCVTVPDDPSEDWFVFATHAHLVRAFFEDYEGFESREAEVRLTSVIADCVGLARMILERVLR
jgi:hypothetical protein